MPTALLSEEDLDLADELKKYYYDPLQFTLDCFEWEPGKGPTINQREFLTKVGQEVRKRDFDGETPVMPIRMAESAGHGTGKSTTCAFVTWWILSTRPKSKGTVSAGSYVQLEERTWPAIQSWGRKCITYHWFEVQAHKVFHKQCPEDWRVHAQSCKEENSQKFAGQHAADSTSWFWFDEASEVPDAIYTVAEGGLTDGEPHIYCLGQMVRNTGKFYEACFGSQAARWNHHRVDSRTSSLTNKPLIDQWEADYGIDSDFYRVRVLGYPPNASELQYIDKTRVNEARSRETYTTPNDPLIAGFDVSGGGKAWNVIRFRRGLDMRTRPAIRIPGEKDPTREQRIAICAELLSDRRPEHRLSALFVDTAFGAPIVQTLKSMGFTNVFEVAFGSESPDQHCANLRAYMYKEMKDWLLQGAIPDEDELARQLCLLGYHIRTGGSKLVIESKADIQKRGEQSPDDADACALTFARKVAIPQEKKKPIVRPRMEYSPYA